MIWCPNKKRTLLSLAIASSMAFSTMASAVTLHQAVEHTVNTNPSIWLSTHVREASRESVNVARSNFFPKVDVNGGIGPENTKSPTTLLRTNELSRREFGVGLKQMLFDAFGTLNDVRRTKYKTNADAYGVSGESNDQAILAIEAYLGILQNRQLVQIARNNLSRVSHIYSLVKKRTSSGIGRKGDLYQGRSRLELAKTNLYAFQNDLLDSMTAFRRVTGLEPKNLSLPKTIPGKYIPPTLRMSVDEAVAHNPKLKAALADVAEAEYQYKSSKSVNWPRLDLVAGVNRDTNIDGLRGINNDVFAMFRVSFNIFNGFGDVSKQREDAFAVDQSADIRNRTLRELIQSIRLSWDSRKTALQRIPALGARQTAARGTVRVYKEQFKLGRRTLLDLLDSENELFTARVNYTRERYLLKISKYRLLADMDHLLPYMHIERPCAAQIPYKETFVLPIVHPDAGIVNSDLRHETLIQKTEADSKRHTSYRSQVEPEHH